MTTLDVAGATLAYRECGNGEPVILLHSSASSNRQWRSLCEQIGDRYRIVAPDLYGYGETDPWPGTGPLTLADEAALVAAVMTRCAGPVHLVGHSYGGAVALRAALENSDRLRSLTLIEPVAFHLLKSHGPAERALYSEVRTIADTVSQAVVDGDFVGGMGRFVDYWNGEGAWSQTKPEARFALSRRLGKVALDFRSTTAEETGIGAYAAIECPTLVLRGDQSPPTTRHIAALLAATLPNARLETISGAGHMAPVTRPDLINDHVVDFLDHHAKPNCPAAAFVDSQLRTPHSNGASS
ncbi:MAG: alpha/beta hydrolase [Alphaproteobacteria bacterium]|nr:alpha/beta hydrolase [Alphaproteobacteria bacterium]